MNNKPYTFVFFGIVGSGKGTQVELLQKYLKDKHLAEDFVFVSPGNQYRKLISEGIYTGQLVKTTLEKGFLQPDFLTTGLITSVLAFEMKENSCLFADAYPRTISQATSFEEIMKYYNRDDIKVIYIEVEREEAIKRMKLRARADDTDEGIAKRFDEYVNNVIPAMNYFKDKVGYTLYTINGEQSIEDVHKELISKIGL
jgi:adenylate kinase